MTWPPKKCWYCGGKNMTPVQTWYQCQDCEATDCGPIKLGTLPINEDPSRIDPNGGSRARSGYAPSPSVARRAARARSGK